MEKSNSDKFNNLETEWEDFQLNHPYKLLKKLDDVANGGLYQAIHLPTQKIYVVKLILAPFENEYKGRQVYREIKILNHLSEFKNNEFTPTIYDIILPDEAIKTKVSKTKHDFKDIIAPDVNKEKTKVGPPNKMFHT